MINDFTASEVGNGTWVEWAAIDHGTYTRIISIAQGSPGSRGGKKGHSGLNSL